MRRKRSPPPSKAAERIKEYLDIINDMQSKRGAALRYDIYRRAGSESQTDRVIKYLKENGLIEHVRVEIKRHIGKHKGERRYIKY